MLPAGDGTMRRLTCLDGLRGVLAFYVMLSHTLPFAPLPGWLLWLFSHGGAAVDVFFVLSGLVIVQSLSSFAYRPGPFLTARVMRIYPVFLVVFVFAMAVQPLGTGFERMAWIDADSPARFIWSGGWPLEWGLFIATHLTMTHGLFPNAVLPDVWVGFLGAAWSLSTEWQFYLLALLIGPRLGLRSVAWLFLAVAVGAVAWHAVAPAGWQFSRAFLPNKAQYSALGIISAVVVRQGSNGFGAYLAVLAATLVLSVMEGGIDKLLPPVLWTLCLAAQLVPTNMLRLPLHGSGAGGGRTIMDWGREHRCPALDPVRRPSPQGERENVCRSAIHAALGLLAAILQSRPLVWLGAVSFCVYLVNEPIQKLLGVALAVVTEGHSTLFTVLWIPGSIVLPILAAWWLHEWIEAPALRWSHNARRAMPAVPVTVG
jgi:peptidoglycan/LPS O-acetylase OafA/YrhL